MRAHLFPVVRDLADRAHIKTRVAVGMAQRFDDGAQRGLAGIARQRIHRASAASTPASAGGKDGAARHPAVSWVWKWMGRSTASFSAGISTAADAGFKSPAISFSPSTCAPASLSAPCPS
jgi:hypothetical protein